MKTKTEAIKDHLIQLADISPDNYKRFYLWLIENGKTFNKRTDFKPKGFNPEIKECFKNSMLVFLNSDIPYFEGYYMTDYIPLPIEHAFNVCDESGEMYDVTADKFCIAVVEWFGVPIPKNVLLDFVQSKHNGITTPLQYYFQKFIYKKGDYCENEINQ